MNHKLLAPNACAGIEELAFPRIAGRRDVIVDYEERRRALRCRGPCRGNAEGSIDHFDEVSFFAKNEPLCLRECEVFTPFQIFL